MFVLGDGQVAVVDWNMGRVSEVEVLRRRERRSLAVMEVVGLEERMMGERYMTGAYRIPRPHVLTVMTVVEGDVVMVVSLVPRQVCGASLTPEAILSLLYQVLSWRPTWHKYMGV